MLFTGSVWGERDPIKIGVDLELTGIMSAPSTNVKKGYDLALKDVGYKVAGRKIEIIEYDNKTDPKISVEVAQKLVEKDKVDILCFGTNSGAAIAVSGYASKVGVPMVVVGMAGAERVILPPSKNVFRITYADGQMELPMGQYAYEKLGHRKMVLMGPDYAGSTGKLWAFRQGFVKAGGEITEIILWPLGTMDVAPYLARIKSGADGIFYFEPGDVSILRFFSSYFEMGYNRKGIGLTGHWIMTDEALGGVPAFGKKLVGVVTGGFTSPHYDTPENKHLNQLYYKQYGTKEVINDNVPMGYDAMRFILKALESIQGNVEDREAFLKAMHATEINGVTGRMSLDKNGNVIRNVLIRKIELVGGKAQNVVVDVIPQVYQPPQGTTLMPGK
jgi:branched-chain amino acid transport system substrate-binding protein